MFGRLASLGGVAVHRRVVAVLDHRLAGPINLQVEARLLIPVDRPELVFGQANLDQIALTLDAA